MDRFFSNYWGRLGLDRDAFMTLGRWEQPWGPQFSMTVLALRTAGLGNGVSELHGEVSRKMWRGPLLARCAAARSSDRLRDKRRAYR